MARSTVIPVAIVATAILAEAEAEEGWAFTTCLPTLLPEVKTRNSIGVYRLIFDAMKRTKEKGKRKKEKEKEKEKGKRKKKKNINPV